jgi:hypothetical protein
MENSMADPKKIKNGTHIQKQYHFWIYMQKNQQDFKETYAHQHSQQYCSQLPRYERTKMSIKEEVAKKNVD